ncbi:MAG TPA: hypothetical protein PKO30_11270 [Prolixibacteraceae bacterium]|nr:hypothetical protein [Prolixibacteraceae bacterium]
MKQLFILIFIGLGVLCASAQENTDNQISTIFSKNRSNGGYGALSFGYTQIDGKDAFLMGARGSWIINHSFAIGLGGTSFINDVNYHNWRNNDLDYNLAGGYGGLYLEPILAHRLPVHISVPILFGVGAIAQVEDHLDWTYDDTRSDVFLVFEPSVELEFNMTRHFRLAGTIGYRFTSKIDMANTNSDVMEGANIGLVFKFGKF